MKPGDYVVCESAIGDSDGYRTITAAVVQTIDDTPTDGHVLAIVVPYATYAYHPEAPHLGRYVPPKKIDCYAIDEMSPHGDLLLRDMVMARAGAPQKVSER